MQDDNPLLPLPTAGSGFMPRQRVEPWRRLLSPGGSANTENVSFARTIDSFVPNYAPGQRMSGNVDDRRSPFGSIGHMELAELGGILRPDPMHSAMGSMGMDAEPSAPAAGAFDAQQIIRALLDNPK